MSPIESPQIRTAEPNEQRIHSEMVKVTSAKIPMSCIKACHPNESIRPLIASDSQEFLSESWLLTHARMNVPRYTIDPSVAHHFVSSEHGRATTHALDTSIRSEHTIYTHAIRKGVFLSGHFFRAENEAWHRFSGRDEPIGLEPLKYTQLSQQVSNALAFEGYHSSIEAGHIEVYTEPILEWLSEMYKHERYTLMIIENLYNFFEKENFCISVRLDSFPDRIRNVISKNNLSDASTQYRIAMGAGDMLQEFCDTSNRSREVRELLKSEEESTYQALSNLAGYRRIESEHMDALMLFLCVRKAQDARAIQRVNMNQNIPLTITSVDIGKARNAKWNLSDTDFDSSTIASPNGQDVLTGYYNETVVTLGEYFNKLHSNPLCVTPGNYSTDVTRERIQNYLKESYKMVL